MNGNGDLGINRADRAWIGEMVIIDRQLKSGLWQVYSRKHPKVTNRFSKRNLDIMAIAVDYPYTNPDAGTQHK